MKKNIDNFKYVLIIFIAAVIALFPLFLKNYVIGHDTMYHASNIISLTEQLKINFLFPSNIVGNIANNFGYGTTLFYSPLAHFVGAYINYFTSNIEVTLKLFHLLTLFLSGVTMYFLSKELSGKRVGLLSAVIYMLFPYHLSDIYIRDALGECILFVFLPLILLGLYNLYHNKINKFYIFFTIGYVGGILSHLNMMIYVTFLIVLFMIFNFKKTLNYIKPLVISSIFILLISSPFLNNLIQHKLYADYTVFIDGVMVEGTQWWGLFLFDYFNVFSKFRLDSIKFYIDIIVLILFMFTIFNYKKIKNKIYDNVFIILIITMFMSTKVFPWDLLPTSFRMIQFPWRLSVIVALLVSLIAPTCINLLNKKNVATYVSVYLILFITVITFSIRFEGSLFDANYLRSDNINYEIGMGWQKEYLPTKTFYNMQYFNNRNNAVIIKDGSGNVSIIDNKVPYLSFKVEGDLTVELPRIYYLGYTLTNGNQTFDLYENDYGFIETKLNSGVYYLSYTKPNYALTFTFVSLLSIIGLILYVRRGYEKN